MTPRIRSLATWTLALGLASGPALHAAHPNPDLGRLEQMLRGEGAEASEVEAHLEALAQAWPQDPRIWMKLAGVRHRVEARWAVRSSLERAARLASASARDRIHELARRKGLEPPADPIVFEQAEPFLDWVAAGGADARVSRELLVRLLKDPDPSVRASALRAADPAHLGDAVQRALAGEGDSEVRGAALRRLQAAAAFLDLGPGAEELARASLGDPEPQVRIEALRILRLLPRDAPMAPPELSLLVRAAHEDQVTLVALVEELARAYDRDEAATAAWARTELEDPDNPGRARLLDAYGILQGSAIGTLAPLLSDPRRIRELFPRVAITFLEGVQAHRAMAAKAFPVQGELGRSVLARVAHPGTVKAIEEILAERGRSELLR